MLLTLPESWQYAAALMHPEGQTVQTRPCEGLANTDKVKRCKSWRVNTRRKNNPFQGELGGQLLQTRNCKASRRCVLHLVALTGTFFACTHFFSQTPATPCHHIHTDKRMLTRALKSDKCDTPRDLIYIQGNDLGLKMKMYANGYVIQIAVIIQINTFWGQIQFGFISFFWL